MKPLICWAIVSKDGRIDIASISFTRRSAIAKWGNMVQPWKYWRDKLGWRAAKVTISLADEAHDRDTQMRTEGRVAGLREAAKLYEDGAGPGAGGWDYFGDFRDAIRALADKIEGEANG